MDKKNRHGFRRFLIAYILLFVLIAVLGVRCFTPIVAGYERSLPKNPVDEYVASFNEDKVRALSAGFVSTINRQIETEEESYAEVLKLFQGEVSCRRISSETSDSSCAYSIIIGGKTAGKIVLETQDPMRGGFAEWIRPRHWAVTSEEISDLSGLMKSASTTVPNNVRVYFGGLELDSSYIKGEPKKIVALKDLYSMNPELPVMVTYEVDGFIAEHEFRYTDLNGNPVELAGDGVSDDAFILENCTEAEKAALDAFAEQFLRLFVNFNSNSGGGFAYNLTELRKLCVPGTTYYDNLALAKDSLSSTAAHNNSIDDITMTSHFRLDADTIVVSLTYLYSEDPGHGQARKQARCDMDLIIKETESGYLVQSCITAPPEAVE